MKQANLITAAFAVLGATLVLFLTVPLVAMMLRESPGSLWTTLLEKDVRAALSVSIGAAAISTAISMVLGVPLGYLLARSEFPGKTLIQAVVDMPVVVPHTVAGIALLTILGPHGFLGGPAGQLGIRFVDALPGTVAAMLFVSAPFVVNAARAGFESVNPRLEKVSRSLGASPARTFIRVSLPLSARPIVAGSIMSWARAVSEFGAILVIAYYPRIGPTLIYERFTSFGLGSSRPVAVLLLAISLILFIALRMFAPAARAGARGIRDA
jgi:molybdate/tungstate transport system permease protein